MSRLLLAGAFASCAISTTASAQAPQGDGAQVAPDTATSPADARETDTTGTDPTVLIRTLNLRNEYQDLRYGSYRTTPELRYTEPFAGGKMSAQLRVPFVGTNVGGEDRFGLSDVALQWAWIPKLTRQYGVSLSAKVTAPTADNDALGGGKWVAAPGFAYVRFVSREIIVAPTIVHNISFAGDSNRAAISRTDADLYFVYRPHGNNWWITSDTTVSQDFKAHVKSATEKVSFGTRLARIGKGAINLSVQPGVGIGGNRTFNWSLQTGISLVGF